MAEGPLDVPPGLEPWLVLPGLWRSENRTAHLGRVCPRCRAWRRVGGPEELCEIGIFRIGGNLYALRTHCPYRGGPLCEGEVIGFVESRAPGELALDDGRSMPTCPWHGWEFEVNTGQSDWNPRRSRARRLPVAEEAGSRIAEQTDSAGTVPGPYVADLIAVAVADDYIVLTTRGQAG